MSDAKDIEAHRQRGELAKGVYDNVEPLGGIEPADENEPGRAAGRATVWQGAGNGRSFGQAHPLSMNRNLFRRGAIDQNDIANPIAYRDDVVDFLDHPEKRRMTQLHQLDHPHGGPWTAPKAPRAEPMTEACGQAARGFSNCPRQPETLQGAARAATHVQPSVAGRPAPEHHDAALAADGRGVIGENNRDATALAGANKPQGDGSRKGVQIDEVRLLPIEDFRKFFRRARIAVVVEFGDIFYRLGDFEPSNRHPVYRVTAILRVRRGNHRFSPALDQLRGQRRDVDLRPADRIGRITKGDVQNFHPITLSAPCRARTRSQ